jgi:2-keto-4-pentenoate hydratase
VLLSVARVLAAHGARLAAGDVVILGSMNPPAIAEPDTRFALELSGVGGVAVDLVA